MNVSKPGTFSCRFLEVLTTIFYHQALKVTKKEFKEEAKIVKCVST